MKYMKQLIILFSSLIPCLFHAMEEPNLHRAVQAGDLEEVQTLLNAGANVNAKAVTDQWTPLHQAAFKGYEAIAKLLLDAGADLNAQTRYGWKPLDLAERNTAVAELLKNWPLKKQGEPPLEELIIPAEGSGEENSETPCPITETPWPTNESWFSQFNNRWIQGGAGATAIAGLAVLGWRLFNRK
jgi:hypothetical protein